jgi:hypothetical protein
VLKWSLTGGVAASADSAGSSPEEEGDASDNHIKEGPSHGQRTLLTLEVTRKFNGMAGKTLFEVDSP